MAPDQARPCSVTSWVKPGGSTNMHSSPPFRRFRILRPCYDAYEAWERRIGMDVAHSDDGWRAG